jgi:hypothetical protein
VRCASPIPSAEPSLKKRAERFYKRMRQPARLGSYTHAMLRTADTPNLAGGISDNVIDPGGRRCAAAGRGQRSWPWWRKAAAIA